MPDSKVLQLIRSQQAKLLAAEQKQMQAMAKRWLEVENALKAQMIALVVDLSAETVVTEAMILRNQRFIRLMYQARVETSKFVQYADELITEKQAQLVAQGIDDVANVLQFIIKDARLGTTFDLLPVDALNAMFGIASDGGPLQSLLLNVHPESTKGLLDKLIEGLALGLNPNDTAALMADGFGMGLQRALTIARTEQLRAYRAASLEQYRNSGVVTGYKRLAKKDSSTCLGCLFSDGELILSLDGDFNEHPNGRCTAVPVVIGASEPTWQTGLEWFKLQPANTQLEMLGPQRYEAWQNGTSLESMTTLVNDSTWGGSYVPTPISDL